MGYPEAPIDPPRLGRWILGRIVGGREAGEIHAGLAELFRVRAASDGAASARAWYWRQVMGFGLRLLRMRTPQRRAPAAGYRGRPRAGALWPRNTVLAVRSLRRYPDFAALATATLALGIGATTAIFSVVNGVILQPLPYADAKSLVAVWPETVSNVRMTEWFADNTRSLEQVSGLTGFEAAITGGGESDRVSGGRVTSNYFEVMNVRPLLGRTFGPEESDPGRTGVVVLSHALWQTRYGGSSDVLGRTVYLDYSPHVVIGVLPPDYRPLDPQYRLWVPQQVEAGTTVGTDATWWIRTRIARLAPGVSVDAAQTELRAAAVRLAEEYPTDLDSADAGRASVMPLQAALVGEFGHTLWILFGAVTLVLLIACSNVATLLLSRAGLKQREVALRTAVGATRSQVVSYLFMESLMLSVLGGVSGIGLAWGTLAAFKTMAAGNVPRIDDVAIDGIVLVFAVGATFFTPLIFGLIPALRATRLSVRDVLNSGGRGSAGSGRPTALTSVLIAGEVATAVVLVIGAGLMVKTLWKLRAVDPGFRTERVLTMHVAVPPAGDGASGGADRIAYRQLWNAIAAVRGVEAVGAIHLLPLTNGNNRYPYWAEDNEPAPGTRAPVANIRVATPGYLDAVGIALLHGRWFTPYDRDGDPPVMVINRTLAARLWPGGSAIGKRVRLLEDDAVPWEVVGVIADVNQMALARTPSPEIYLPHEQWTWPTMFATIRTAGLPEAVVPAVRQAISRVDEDITVSRVATMEDVTAESVAGNRFFAGLITLFALLALGLGAIGVYGVTSHAVSGRIPEFGVRMALGSSRRRVLRDAMVYGLKPVAIGVAVGVGAAWGASRLLSTLLFEVAPTDLATYGVVVALLFIVACLASYLPARRASAVDPVVALRIE